jgi:hypothetical protein
MGFKPELSASAVGMPSKASANARIAYYSTVEIYNIILFNITESAKLETLREQANSVEPPP